MEVKAAIAHKMVGISKPTFYKHVKEKPISTSTKNGALMVDVSELIRVYGEENLKTPEQVEQESQKKNKDTNKSPEDGAFVSLEEKIELERLREKVSNFDKERKQLLDQIDTLKDYYEKSEEQRNKITALLTDQRDEKQKFHDKEKLQTETLERLEKELLELKEQQIKILSEKVKKKGVFSRLFGT